MRHKLMSRRVSISLWIIAVAVAMWSILYFFAHFRSAPFVESAMGNLFATILGILVSVPFALAINRHQQESALAISLSERTHEEAVRKKKVLGLLSLEIQSNLEAIRNRRVPMDTGGKRMVDSQSLKSLIWTAFSDGGELHYVNNPEVLAALANAYENIRNCAMLEIKFLEAIHWPGAQFRQTKSPQDFILEYLEQDDPALIDSMERALQAIELEVNL